MSTSAATLDSDKDGQIVLILVGLIASGKTTFAQALEQHLPNTFRRCNQDDLGGDRRRVENLARCTLREGLSACIDRTNFDKVQRSHWIKIAQEFPGTSVHVIVFDTPYETCATRIRERTSHPTIKSPEQGLAVLARFTSDFQYPSPHEGFDRLLELKLSDHPSPLYTDSDVRFILERLRNATVAASSNFSLASSAWTRGASLSRNNRARGGYNHRNAGIPRARRAFLSPHINSRGRGSAMPPNGKGFGNVGGSITNQHDYHHNYANSRRTLRGGTSASPDWRGSGSVEDPLTIT